MTTQCGSTPRWSTSGTLPNRRLRRLVETELGANLVGTELFVTGYASTYVGLAFRDAADAPLVQGIASRVLMRQGKPASAEEATARMLAHLVHAATPTLEDLGAVGALPPADFSPLLVRRLADLWQADVWRLGLAQAETSRVQAAWEQEVAHARRLKSDLEAAISDRTLSHVEVTTGIVAAHARLAAVQADLDAKIAAEEALRRQEASLAQERLSLQAERLSLDAERARLDAEAASTAALQDAAVAREQRAIAWQAAAAADLGHYRAALEDEWAAVRVVQAGNAWRAVAVLREAGRRHPGVARPARKVARVLWWTLRGWRHYFIRFRRETKAAVKCSIVINLLLRLP